jgi:hypothetical protein
LLRRENSRFFGGFVLDTLFANFSLCVFVHPPTPNGNNIHTVKLCCLLFCPTKKEPPKGSSLVIV